MFDYILLLFSLLEDLLAELRERDSFAHGIAPPPPPDLPPEDDLEMGEDEDLYDVPDEVREQYERAAVTVAH